MNATLLITHAAGLLTAEARGLRECHTPEGNGDWNGEPEAKAVYDDMTITAAGLLALASNMEIKLNRGR